MSEAPNTAFTKIKERKRFSLQEYAIEYAVLILLCAVIIALAILSPSFFTFGNIVNILNQNAPLLIIAAASTFVIISGNFDLSTGAIFGVAGVVAAWLAVTFGNVWLALLAAPIVGIVLGAFNGVVITKLRIHSFLATLGNDRGLYLARSQPHRRDLRGRVPYADRCGGVLAVALTYGLRSSRVRGRWQCRGRRAIRYQG